MSNGQTLNSLMSRDLRGKQIPALQLVRKEPEVAAVVSKLVKPRDAGSHGLNEKTRNTNINQSQLQAVSETIKSRIEDNENITQIFPDIELAIQIIVSSVLSPKDMVKTDIIYKQSENILPSSVTLKMMEVIEKHFESHYKIKEELQDILRESIFTSGSYIKAVLPESVIDEIINSRQAITTESLSDFYLNDKTVHLGILGNPGAITSKSPSSIVLERLANRTTAISQESILDGSSPLVPGNLLEVTDNFNFLKLPRVNERMIKDSIRKKVGGAIKSSLEHSNLNNVEFSNVIYKSGATDTMTVVNIPGRLNTKRKSIGRPLTMKLPSESVIPVFTPGDAKRHVGYFVLVDIDGHPVSGTSELAVNSASGGLDSLLANSTNAANNGLAGSLIQKAKNNLVNKDNSNVTLAQIVKAYGDIIETDLTERLRNGVYQSEMTIGGNEEIYRIMLARSLANKYCRLIYIPGEYVTYFAFKHFKNGVGKSYLDDLKVLTSLRSILLFAKVMAQVKSSINLTHVNINLDPKDPDPQKTIEIAQHEIAKLRQNYFPLGINSPTDITDWIQKVGIEFSYEGHPGLPETKFDFETKNLQHTVPDSELDELLRKQTYMALGLSPETIDNGFNSEFATTVVANNILLSKRISQLQDRFSSQLSDFLRKLITNDSVIIREMKEVIDDNKNAVMEYLTKSERSEFVKQDEDETLSEIIKAFVEGVNLEFPKPDETSLENQTVAFNAYVEALEKVLDHWVSSEFITSDVVGDINSNIDSVKAILKSYFIRKWQAENNYMNELSEIVTSDDDGKASLDLYEINKSHLEAITRSVLIFLKDMKPIANAANKDLETLGTPEGTVDSSSSSDSSDDGSGGGGGDLGLGGMDDLGLDGGMDNAGGGDGLDTPPTGDEEPKPDDTKPEGE